MSGQDNHYKSYDFLKNLKNQFEKVKKYLKSYIFWFIQKQSLVIDYQISVIDYTTFMWKDVTLHIWI